MSHLNNDISEQLKDLKDKQQEILINGLAGDDEKKAMIEQLISDKSDVIYDKLKDIHKKGVKPIGFKPIDVKYDDDYIKNKEGLFNLLNYNGDILGDFNSLSNKPNPTFELDNKFKEICKLLKESGGELENTYKESINDLYSINQDYKTIYKSFNKIRFLLFNAHIKQEDSFDNVKKLNYLSNLKDNAKNMRNNFVSFEDRLKEAFEEFFKHFNETSEFDDTDNKINDIILPIKNKLNSISIDNKSYTLYNDIVNINNEWSTAAAPDNPVNDNEFICFDPLHYGATYGGNQDAAIQVGNLNPNIYPMGMGIRSPPNTRNPVDINTKSLQDSIFPEIISMAITEYFIYRKNSSNNNVTDDQTNKIITDTFNRAANILSNRIDNLFAGVPAANTITELYTIKSNLNSLFVKLAGDCISIISNFIEDKNNQFQYTPTRIVSGNYYLESYPPGNPIGLINDINIKITNYDDFIQLYKHNNVAGNPVIPIIDSVGNPIKLSSNELISRRIRYSTAPNLESNKKIISIASCIIEIIHTQFIKEILNSNNIINNLGLIGANNDTRVNQIYRSPGRIAFSLLQMVDRPRMTYKTFDQPIAPNPGNDYIDAPVNYYEAELVKRISNYVDSGLLPFRNNIPNYNFNPKGLYYKIIDEQTKKDVINNLNPNFSYALKNICDILNIIRYSNLDYDFSGIDEIALNNPILGQNQIFSPNSKNIINQTKLFYDVNRFSSVNKTKNTLIKYFGLTTGFVLHLVENFKNYLPDSQGRWMNNNNYPINILANQLQNFFYMIGFNRRILNDNSYRIYNDKIYKILFETFNNTFSQNLILPNTANPGFNQFSWQDRVNLFGLINNIDLTYIHLIRCSLINNILILNNLKVNSNDSLGFNSENKDFDNFERLDTFDFLQNDDIISKSFTIGLLSLYSGISLIKKINNSIPDILDPLVHAPNIYYINDNYKINNNDVDRIYNDINKQIFDSKVRLENEQNYNILFDRLNNYNDDLINNFFANLSKKEIFERLTLYTTISLCYIELEQQNILFNDNLLDQSIRQTVNSLYVTRDLRVPPNSFFNIPSQVRPISNVASNICTKLKTLKKKLILKIMNLL